MAWSSPFTAVTGNVFTAAQWNQYARDNLLVSEAAVAMTAGTTTFTAKYRTTAGGGTSTFAHRVIAVVPF